MRRFLLSLFFVGALSAVFSFSAFAGTQYVESSYMSSGQVVFTDKASYGVSASEGDVYYIDLSVSTGYESILTSSGVNITSSVYNRDFSSSFSIEAIGSSYGAADVVMEGSRAWIFFNRSVPSVTLTFQITLSASWYGGTLAEQSPYTLSDCIARIPFTVSFSSLHSFSTDNPTDISITEDIASVQSDVDKLLDLLSDSDKTKDFLGPDALIYFDDEYFSSLYSSSGSVVFGSSGYIEISGVTSFSLYNHNVQDSLFLTPGSYYILCSSPQELSSFYLSTNGYSGSVSDYYSISLASVSHRYSMYSHVYILTVHKSFLLDEIVVSSASSMSGTFYGGIVPWSDDDLAGAAINPDQDSTVSDVDDAGHQQSQQEEEMWQNINTYKGDISFNLDGWDDAAGGLSYVTGVFMTIWNNSPTQPIVLSLMLGIAMLSIGRGVMAAVRVSRNRGDD